MWNNYECVRTFFINILDAFSFITLFRNYYKYTKFYGDNVPILEKIKMIATYLFY